MKRIYLIRHGQSVANAHNVVPDRETPLSELGRHQAHQLADRLQNVSLDAIIASDFPRAQETATPTSEALGLPIEVQPCFHEMLDPSEFFGVSEDDERIAQCRIERNAKLGADPDWKYGDGESISELFVRMNQAAHLLQTHAADNIAVFGHGFYTMAFVSKLVLNIDEPTPEWFQLLRSIKISNVGVTLLEWNEAWRLVILNDHAHFAE